MHAQGLLLVLMIAGCVSYVRPSVMLPVEDARASSDRPFANPVAEQTQKPPPEIQRSQNRLVPKRILESIAFALATIAGAQPAVLLEFDEVPAEPENEQLEESQAARDAEQPGK